MHVVKSDIVAVDENRHSVKLTEMEPTNHSRRRN